MPHSAPVRPQQAPRERLRGCINASVYRCREGGKHTIVARGGEAQNDSDTLATALGRVSQRITTTSIPHTSSFAASDHAHRRGVHGPKQGVCMDVGRIRARETASLPVSSARRQITGATGMQRCTGICAMRHQNQKQNSVGDSGRTYSRRSSSCLGNALPPLSTVYVASEQTSRHTRMLH